MNLQFFIIPNSELQRTIRFQCRNKEMQSRCELHPPNVKEEKGVKSDKHKAAESFKRENEHLNCKGAYCYNLSSIQVITMPSHK